MSAPSSPVDTAKLVGLFEFVRAAGSLQVALGEMRLRGSCKKPTQVLFNVGRRTRAVVNADGSTLGASRYIDRLIEIAGEADFGAAAFGKATGSCAMCRRKLTDPISMGFGIGPDCRKGQLRALAHVGGVLTGRAGA